MKNIVVDYESILTYIKKQFLTIRDGIEEFNDIVFDVGDEQYLAKNNPDPNAIFILVKFSGATTNFGQAVVPVNLEIIGLNNEIQKTQKFLNYYVNEYNRKQDGNLTQLYLTPTVSTNLNPIYNGFRSLFMISGTLVIDNSLLKLNKLKYYPDPDSDEFEEIEVISFEDHGENSLNPQPYSDNHGRVKSYGGFSTLGFTIVTFPDSDKQLIQKIHENKYDFTHSHMNDTFCFSFDFLGFGETAKQNFKLHSSDFNQRIGENPTLSAAFSL